MQGSSEGTDGGVRPRGNRPAGDGWRVWRTLLPIGVVVFASLVLGIAGWILYDSTRAAPPAPALASTPSAQAAVEFARERLELYDRRARDLQWLLGALLATGALFTLLQGVFAFFSVQNFNAQAEAGLRNVSEAARKIDVTREALEEQFREKMSDLESELRSQFPLASRMEESLDKTLVLLESHFQDANWDEDLFARLGEREREEIYFHERVIAGFASLKVPKLRERLGRAFRRLGSFYTSRFLASPVRSAKELTGPLAGVLRQTAEADLQRARFYLEMALERNERDFAAMNMLGYIALELLTPRDREQARNWFEKSRKVRPDQQRAQFDLAYIAYLLDHDVAKAIALYREALANSRWEFEPSAKDANYIRLNLGCVLVQMWKQTGSDALAEEALAFVANAMRSGREYVREYLERECSPGWDLAPLLDNSRYAGRLEQIRTL